MLGFIRCIQQGKATPFLDKTMTARSSLFTLEVSGAILIMLCSSVKSAQHAIDVALITRLYTDGGGDFDRYILIRVLCIHVSI